MPSKRDYLNVEAEAFMAGQVGFPWAPTVLPIQKFKRRSKKLFQHVSTNFKYRSNKKKKKVRKVWPPRKPKTGWPKVPPFPFCQENVRKVPTKKKDLAETAQPTPTGPRCDPTPEEIQQQSLGKKEKENEDSSTALTWLSQTVQFKIII